MGSESMRLDGSPAPLRRVRKKAGYKWPGMIVAEFLTTAGERRVVVECTAEDVRCALHIFNPDQLEDYPNGRPQ